MNFQIFAFFGVILAVVAGAPLEEVTNGNNLFTASLYKELATIKRDNIVVSPFSIEVILALTQSGAKAETAEEIRTVLNLPNDNEKIQMMFRNVIPLLKGDVNFTMNTANKIYVKEGLTLQDDFKKTAKEVYQAEAESIDFSKNIEAAEAMNQWVEEQTENAIEDLVDPDSLSPLTTAFIINALHFKGQWLGGFNSALTTKKPFYKNTRDFAQVEMMSSAAILRNYSENQELNAQVLELPFWGANISMVFVVPKEIDGIGTLENQLHKVFAPHKFEQQFITAEIPRFKIESTVDLKETLQNLGLKQAFDSNTADLSGIIKEDEDLYIDKIQQKTFIDLDEKGVEAAAATFEQINTLAAPGVTFKADRPFIFYIKFNDLVLLAGRVTSP